MNVDAKLLRNAPEHVPPHLFWDHDLVEYTGELEDPFVSGLLTMSRKSPRSA